MMTKISYSGYRFPPEIIQQAIWLYVRFTLSFRDVEDLLAERGIFVSYETVRRWVNHFGPMIAADLRRRRPKPHTTWHLDEVYLKIDGRLVYLWRAVDAEGEVLDVLVQTKEEQAGGAKIDAQAAEEIWLLSPTSWSQMTSDLMLLQPGILESQNAMNAVDGATIERRIRINRPDDENTRCKVSRAWDPRKDFSQCMQQPTILSTSSAISPQQERTAPSGHRPC
jgi:DDE domain